MQRKGRLQANGTDPPVGAFHETPAGTRLPPRCCTHQPPHPFVGAGLTPRALAPPTAHSSQGVAGAAPPADPATRNVNVTNPPVGADDSVRPDEQNGAPFKRTPRSGARGILYSRAQQSTGLLLPRPSAPWAAALGARFSSPTGTKKERPPLRSLFFGAPLGIRTPDTLLKRQVLYLLS